jgi:hypothetical protein
MPDYANTLDIFYDYYSLSKYPDLNEGTAIMFLGEEYQG